MTQERLLLAWYRQSLHRIMIRAGLAVVNLGGKLVPTAAGAPLFRPQYLASVEFRGKDEKRSQRALFCSVPPQ